MHALLRPLSKIDWQFLVIYEELIGNFIFALIAVAAFSLLVLGKVSVVALVCFTVVRRLLCSLLSLKQFFLSGVTYNALCAHPALRCLWLAAVSSLVVQLVYHYLKISVGNEKLPLSGWRAV